MNVQPEHFISLHNPELERMLEVLIPAYATLRHSRSRMERRWEFKLEQFRETNQASLLSIDCWFGVAVKQTVSLSFLQHQKARGHMDTLYSISSHTFRHTQTAG